MTAGNEQVRCPKCGGKIYFDRDYYGWYEKCLYCGWSRDLPGIVLAESEKPRVKVLKSPLETATPARKTIGHGTAKKRKHGSE